MLWTNPCLFSKVRSETVASGDLLPAAPGTKSRPPTRRQERRSLLSPPLTTTKSVTQAGPRAKCLLRQSTPGMPGSSTWETRPGPRNVLKNLGKYYPDASEYEVAGFLWWQGDKDRYNAAHATVYGKNLNQLFKALRKGIRCPRAKMVVATLGQTNKETATGNERLIIDGMFAFGDKHKGEAAVVYTNPVSMGSSSNAHYGGNAKTIYERRIGHGRSDGRAPKEQVIFGLFPVTKSPRLALPNCENDFPCK